jgi:dipeptidyl aminopeptidase/acylaminoacyl peptidase
MAILSQKLPAEKLRVFSELSEVVTVKKISYLANGRKAVGFIVQPKNAEAKKFVPVIWARGGYKAFGEWKVYHLFAELGRLASFGFCVLTTQYAGNDGAEGKDEYGGMDVDDLVALKDVIDEQESFDASRIGVIGSSRGGMMVLEAAKKTAWVKKAFLISPISDLRSLRDFRPEFTAVFKEAFGDTEEGLKDRSPIEWVGELPKDMEITILHGDADDRVPIEQSRKLASALQQEGIPVHLLEISGGDHGLASHGEMKWETILDWAKSL